MQVGERVIENRNSKKVVDDDM